MISIIIPTLNEATVIEKTLSNLRSAKKHHCEIIISDGGSTDATLEIAKKYADTVLVHDGSFRQTIAMGRNDGAKKAHGDFLLFMDSDVTIPGPDNFFDELLKTFENKKISAVGVYIKVLPEYASLSDKIIFCLLNWSLVLQNNFLGIGGAPGEFQVIRREVFETLHGYRQDLVAGEDYEFFFRISKKIGKTYFNRHLAVYHTGRRAHKVGWPRLLLEWWGNGVYIILFNRSRSKVWKEVR